MITPTRTDWRGNPYTIGTTVLYPLNTGWWCHSKWPFSGEVHHQLSATVVWLDRW